MERERLILKILNDGRFHSGEALATQLEISRAAVWKIIHNLKEWGLNIYTISGKGYRLAEPVELLDKLRILDEMTPYARDLLGDIEIHHAIDSTNSYLMSRARCGIPSGSVCCAERQLAGRGRRGRTWISPFAANLYLSLLWRFPLGPGQLSGLSLITGVAVARVLQSIGVVDIGLKWPNDLLWRQRKLGGILLEFGGESSGPCYVVTGIGLNVAMPDKAARGIDQPWTDLRSILESSRISRNQLAASILNGLIEAFVRFEYRGLEAIVDTWKRFDQVAGKAVRLNLPNSQVDGIARGVDETGAVLLETRHGLERFMGGEISLRVES